MDFVKEILKYLAEKNYVTAKALWMRGQRKKIQFCKTPIINYQMGKVGSSTVQASLEARNLGCPVYHVHFLNPHRVQELEDQRRKHFGTERYGSLKRAWLYRFLYKEIQRQDRRWKLITMVREPIARNISTFFENLEVRIKPDSALYTVKSDYYGFDDVDVDLENVEPLIELFFDRLVHERPLRYFDDEIKTVFGIDIFASEFPREKGYQLLHGDNADLLLIRLDDLNQCAGQAFKEFLAIDDFCLLQTNVGGNKIYAPLYKEFQRRIQVPQDYIERMYTSRYARQFYNQDELQQFAYRWSGDAR